MSYTRPEFESKFDCLIFRVSLMSLQDPNLRVKERDESLQKQFDLIRVSLMSSGYKTPI